MNFLEVTDTLYNPFPAKNDYTNNNSSESYGEDYIDNEKLNVIDKGFSIPDNESLANYLLFDLPDWGVEDYISDRDKWVKGKRSIADEPGWFYFKVFFKFNTNFGLFGGVLDENKLMKSTCALRYLNNIKTLYKSEQIPMRINALGKFVSILSQINTKYPWMIKGVGGLSKAMNSYIDNFDNSEKTIQLTFNTETTDMKVINMLNYYKLACYDDINCKEIIPENLRKFDMMIVFYHIPIKYFQTAIMVAPKRDLTTGLMKPGSKLAKAEEIVNKTLNFLTTKSTYYKYKRMMPENNDYSNMMSFNMFTFNNCEFDVNSFGNYFDGNDLKNDTAFQFSSTSISIKYERVYYHTMNEWSQTFFGSDGFYYDPNFPSGSTLPDSRVDKIRDVKSNSFANRLKSLKEARAGSTFFDKNAEQYKSLIDFSESVITDGLMNMKMENYYSFLKGNLYGGKIGVNSDYFNAKMSALNDGTVSGNLYGDLGLKTVNTRYGSEIKKSDYFEEKMKILNDGTVSGNLYGDVGLKTVTSPSGSKTIERSPYFEEKMKILNDGTVSGNLYGDVGLKTTSDEIVKSRYFTEKMNSLNKGVELGNLYGDNLGITSNGDNTYMKSPYFMKKERALKKGTISGNIYGTNTEEYDSYFTKKLKAIKYGTLNTDSSNTGNTLYKDIKQELINDVENFSPNYTYSDIKKLLEKLKNYVNHVEDNKLEQKPLKDIFMAMDINVNNLNIDESYKESLLKSLTYSKNHSKLNFLGNKLLDQLFVLYNDINKLNIDSSKQKLLDDIKTIERELNNFSIDQRKKQKTDIVQYLSGNLGDLNEKSLTKGIKDTISKATSFFKMSKKDW